MGRETWAQAAERAARYELARARKIQLRAERKEEIGGGDLITLDDNSSAMRYLRHRYQHIVVDEAQDLSSAHWKMLRAMVAPGADDLFIAGDTHQRIYDRQVTLSTVGVNIRGRASKLTLSYRTTQEILDQAARVVERETYDDLDDGTDNLDGYHSLLRGPTPDFVACADRSRNSPMPSSSGARRSPAPPKTALYATPAARWPSASQTATWPAASPPT
ncbi:UvrD-helicase domain-containing protein [Streptomyces sp. NPDC006703]|uniref:UvrD-helicase domain-containing protein n=1 Tax=Streptomyces sp. NPDC006703 TaxID=3364759 RepID=UPI0036BA1E25